MRIAAALVLGAEGVNLGTRFLASEEALVAEGWKKAILAAQSQDAIKLSCGTAYGGGAFDVVPRAFGTAFTEEWNVDRPETLDRFTSFFRLAWVIPIFIHPCLLSGSGDQTVVSETGERIRQPVWGPLPASRWRHVDDRLPAVYPRCWCAW